MGCHNTKVAPVLPVQSYSEPTAEDLNTLQEQLSKSLANRNGATSNRGNLTSLSSGARRFSYPLPKNAAEIVEQPSNGLPGAPLQGSLQSLPFHANNQLQINTSLHGLASESQVIFFQKLEEKIKAGPELRKSFRSERPNS